MRIVDSDVFKPSSKFFHEDIVIRVDLISVMLLDRLELKDKSVVEGILRDGTHRRRGGFSKAPAGNHVDLEKGAQASFEGGFLLIRDGRIEPEIYIVSDHAASLGQPPDFINRRI